MTQPLIAASRRESQCPPAVTAPAAGRPTGRGTCLAIVLWSVLGILLAQPVAAQVATGTSVAVIVNPDNPVKNLSLAELRDILNGQRAYWSPARPVSMIVMPGLGSPERRIVLRVVLSMDEASYRKLWLGRIFRAESGSAPTTVDSPDVIRRAVARIRGAIGLVATASPDVRVVRVNGTLPGDAVYPLR